MFAITEAAHFTHSLVGLLRARSYVLSLDV